MTTDLQLALAKTRSMKITLFNAIAELGIRSEQALIDGNETLSSQLSLQAVALGKQATNVRRAESKIRAANGLSQAVSKLDLIAADAREALARLEGTANSLAAATKLINIVSKVISVLA